MSSGHLTSNHPTLGIVTSGQARSDQDAGQVQK